ncbi:MAG: hypothetical protein HND47_09490 [Chloroflexi bacterium]|nr:hypothetical protein [Chloroflexota bacterium]
MKESENQSNSKITLNHVFIAIVIFGCINVITLFFTARTPAPTLPDATSTPIYVTPSNTPLAVSTNQPQPSATLFIFPSATPILVRQMPEIENNLLKNNGFEDGLSNWVYLDKQAGFSVFEVKGVNGKGFCSRRYIPLTSDLDDLVKNEWEGISQEVLIDPNQSYFFSGWVKLNKAFSILAIAEFYSGSRYIGYAVFTLATQPTAVLPDGETTRGWVFIYGEVPTIPPGTTRAFVGFRHGIINNPPKAVDSTFCIDDLVFGQIVK